MVRHCPLRVERAEGRGVVWVSDDGKLRDVQAALAEQSALPRKILATLSGPPGQQRRKRKKIPQTRHRKFDLLNSGFSDSEFSPTMTRDLYSLSRYLSPRTVSTRVACNQAK